MRLLKRGRSYLLVFSLILLALLTNACDCIWTARGHAWLDENRNGVQDEGEPPLEGVMFLIDDVRNGYQRVGEQGISDAEGNAEIGVFIAGCPPTRFEVYAVAPAGYEHTTPARLSSGQSRDAEGKEVFSFGFAYTPGVTPTPRPTPAPMSCRTFNIPYIDTGYGRDAIDFTADGAGWILSNFHTRRLLALKPDGEVIEIPRDQDPLGSSNAYALAVDEDGNVWVGATEGLSKFQPRTGRWTSFTQQHGLQGSDVSAVAVLGETILVRTDAGIEALSASGEGQLLIPTENMQSQDGGWFIKTDHAVFYLANDYLFRFRLDSQGALAWDRIWDRTEAPVPIQFISDGDMPTDSTLWLGGRNDARDHVVASWNLNTGEITPHTFQSSGGVLGKDWISSVAAESVDRVWVGIGDEVIAGMPGEDGAGVMTWTVYDARALHVPTLESVRHLAVSPDRALWIRTKYSWIRCSPSD